MLFSVSELQIFSKRQYSDEVLEIPQIWQQKSFL